MCINMQLATRTTVWLQCSFGHPVPFLLGLLHRPGVHVPQPAAVRLIRCWITLSSWIISPLVAAHAERNCACVSRTDHGCLAEYGCDGAHEEAGLGRMPLCHELHVANTCQSFPQRFDTWQYLGQSGVKILLTIHVVGREWKYSCVLAYKGVQEAAECM